MLLSRERERMAAEIRATTADAEERVRDVEKAAEILQQELLQLKTSVRTLERKLEEKEGLIESAKKETDAVLQAKHEAEDTLEAERAQHMENEKKVLVLEQEVTKQVGLKVR